VKTKNPNFTEIILNTPVKLGFHFINLLDLEAFSTKQKTKE
jgi:hypothetical protein